MTFAGLNSKEYISKKGMSVLKESYIHIFEIDEYLKKLYEQGKIAGFEGRILKSVEDVYDEDLDIDALNDINEGNFPCVWINITYKPEILQESELIGIEEKFALVSLYSYSSSS
jgi:hypothetical protein